MKIQINGKKITIKPTQAIGKGGEADIFQLDKHTAIKLFKPPTHPDYKLFSQEQKAAELRLKEHQDKLGQFPTHLPQNVITPQTLVTDDKNQQILGYTMPLIADAEVLLKYSEKSFRLNRIPNETIITLFQSINHTLNQLHQSNVIIGDFNDLNILIKDKTPYFIDTDSYQFGKFLCHVFTARFVDPLLCNKQLVLDQPYTPHSDWYAFNIMLMQCLLFVSPYGGVYKPKKASEKVPQNQRPLHRITIFHPEVKYPKPAIPYQTLSDDLLHHFYQVFEQDQRGQFVRSLLDNLTWQTCPTCHIEHARNTCPLCTHTQIIPSVPPVGVTTVRGTVEATKITSTEGIILTARFFGKSLQWLYHKNEAFYRENDTLLFEGHLDPNLHLEIQEESTHLGQQGQVITLTPHQPLNRLAVDMWGQQVQYAVNSKTRYWLHNGQLLKAGRLGTEYIGDVLPHQTRFWVGETFGLGFYRAGNLSVVFIFDCHRRGINDQINLNFGAGQLLDATCTFSEQYCWFFWSMQTQGKRIQNCAVLRPTGEIVAQSSSENEPWLQHLSGKCAVGSFLLSATDEGIVRIEPNQGQLTVTREFPDTEPFVQSTSHLIAGKEGLYVVQPHSIYLLAIK